MTPLAAAVDDLTGAFPPVDLDEVVRLAALQVRLDRKYLVPADEVPGLVEELAGGYRALDIGGRRLFGYESVYFDTADLATFRAHRQGRRRRYKLRTRTYTDSGDCLVEVKLKDRRGITVKHRLPHPPECRDRLDDRAHAFIASALAGICLDPPPALVPVLRTTYRRATLVDLGDGARVTFDVDLRFCGSGRHAADAQPGGTAPGGAGRVVVESKSAGWSSADRVLARRGFRPVRLSKYCVGIAITRPELAANRWNRVLRQDFGWTRAESFPDE